jgi:hypothetical protein
MSYTTLLLNGFSFAEKNPFEPPSFPARELHFAYDAVISLHVVGARDNDEVSPSSMVIAIEIYNSPQDYVLNRAALRYAPHSKWDSAGVTRIGRGRGYPYFEFDASSFSCPDPEAPKLGRMVVATGVKLGRSALAPMPLFAEEQARA